MRLERLADPNEPPTLKPLLRAWIAAAVPFGRDPMDWSTEP